MRRGCGSLLRMIHQIQANNTPDQKRRPIKETWGACHDDGHGCPHQDPCGSSQWIRRCVPRPRVVVLFKKVTCWDKSDAPPRCAHGYNSYDYSYLEKSPGRKIWRSFPRWINNRWYFHTQAENHLPLLPLLARIFSCEWMHYEKQSHSHEKQQGNKAADRLNSSSACSRMIRIISPTDGQCPVRRQQTGVLLPVRSPAT